MEDLERKAVLLSFSDALRRQESWCGETHLQKATFFLQQLTEVPLEFTFILWKFGPYSFDLKEEIGELIGYGLMTLKPNSPPYGPTYATTPRALKLVECQGAAPKLYESQIAFVAQQLGPLGVVDLEKLGTALLIMRDNPELTSQEVAEKISRVKQHVAREEAQVAVTQVCGIQAQWRALRALR